MYSAESSWDFSSYKSYYALSTMNGWIPYGINGAPDAAIAARAPSMARSITPIGTAQTTRPTIADTTGASPTLCRSIGRGQTDPITPGWTATGHAQLEHANEIGPHPLLPAVWRLAPIMLAPQRRLRGRRLFGRSMSSMSTTGRCSTQSSRRSTLHGHQVGCTLARARRDWPQCQQRSTMWRPMAPSSGTRPPIAATATTSLASGRDDAEALNQAVAQRAKL